MQRKIVVRANTLAPHRSGEMVGFTRQEAGWDYMTFTASRLLPGETLERTIVDEELALVWMGGRCIANWGAGEQAIGSRANVFDGLPYTLYLPAGSHVTLRAETVCELAACSVPSQAQLAPRLITPNEVATSLRGGENASRQIVEVIPSSFPADKLVVFEVYTPGATGRATHPTSTTSTGPGRSRP